MPSPLSASAPARPTPDPPRPDGPERVDEAAVAVAETTPLLAGARVADEAVTAAAAAAAAPRLPRAPLFLLCYARMTEPVAFFAIFPYIAQMVQRNGQLAESDVGFYSGLIESVFSLAQMCCLLGWGRLADAVGRKPVLVYSLGCMAVGPVLFGLARSLGQMLLFRCLAGVFSGSGLVVRTMIGDLCVTPDAQARAFGWFSFAGNVGILVGPVVGGLLAEPARNMPALFGTRGFFADYPYALPGFAIGFVVATAALACGLFLEETLDRKGASPVDTPPDDARPGADMSVRQLLRAPGVAVVIALYSHVMLLAFVFTAILPLALFTPVALGGMGFSSAGISLYMAVQGLSQGLWLLLVFPRLHRRLGTKGVLRLCAAGYPWFFAGHALLNLLLRRGSDPARVCFYVLGSAVAVVGPAVSMAFTCVQLALQTVSPHPHLLGTLNALALTLASAIRSFAPGLATVVYAVGVRNQILYGHLAWVVLVLLSATLSVMLKWLPDDPV